MKASTDAAKASGRLEFLDAARGLAATSVVLQHTFESILPGFKMWSEHHLNFGVVGVVVFFLISGFIIPLSIARAGKLTVFWGGRFFRLYPIYWVSLIVALGLWRWNVIGMPADFLTRAVFDPLVNFTMLQSFFRVPDALGIYWTLSLELVFYVLCSLIFRAGWQSRSLVWAWVASGGMALAVLIAGIGFHRSLPAGRLGLFVAAFLGTVIYDVHSKRLGSRRLYGLFAATLIPYAAGFWFRFQLYPARADGDDFSMTGVSASWCVGFLLFAVLYFLRASEFPKWMLWLGRISYSLYLVHLIVLAQLPHTVAPVIFVSESVILSVAISGITFQFVEKPAINFYRKRMREHGFPGTPTVAKV